MVTSGKLVTDLKGYMATHLIKTSLHQLEQLGTILKQGWSHPENPARPPSIPNKHPSTFPSSGLTENSQRNPNPIPRDPAHSILQPPACLDLQVGVHQKISNQAPNHIAQLRSNSKNSPATSMARTEHVTNYGSILIPTPQQPRKATPPRLAPPPKVEYPATPRKSTGSLMYY